MFYLPSNCFEITLELGCCKFPPAQYILPYWNANRQAMIKFIELVHTTGIRGFVFDDKGRPIQGARIVVEDRAKKVKTYEDGDFWRLLVPGSYIIRAAKRKYKSVKKRVVINPRLITVVNFTLSKNKRNIGRRRPLKITPIEIKQAVNFTFHPIEAHRDRLRLSAKSPNKSNGRLTIHLPFKTTIACLVLAFAYL